MPIVPLTWSELSLWTESKEDWNRRYILGLQEPANHYMQRGTDIHNMLFTGFREDEKERYTSDEIRVHDKILKTAGGLLAGEKWRHELKLEADLGGIPIKGYLDGFRPCDLLEVKTGARLWDEEIARKHGQLHFYDLLLIHNNLQIEQNLLLSCSTKNGACVLMDFPVSDEDLSKMIMLITEAHSWMVKADLWQRRISSKDRITV